MKATKLEIPAGEAMPSFKSAGIQVQVATPAKRNADGVARGFDVKMKPLAAEHILRAVALSDGRVAITTIDGRRYEARAS